ncbi:MAG TPA: DNA-processing protein DprA [Phycisphaerae bacterium]|nr:DNA-processing protein DprA [Phycisphaerae bacterium]
MSDVAHRRRLYLRLALAEGVGPLTARRLVDQFGGIEAVFEGPLSRLKGVPGVGAKRAEAVAAVDESALDEELEQAHRAGAAVVCFEDPEYPESLRHIPDGPPVLYVLGGLRTEDAVAVGVVGSRRCTHYGLEQAERFGALLGRAGFSVVSGGARGIDTAAHRGTLAAGGRTIVVMGCGLGKLYPPENDKLFRRIIEEGRGAVISELPMSVGVRGENFPKRNRIISGMSLGLLVIEAARRSGSLITAGSAAEQNKEVFALPGRVDSPFSAGTNQLIADGATLVQDLEDLLNGLGRVGETMIEEGAAEPVKPQIELTGVEAKIMNQLAAMELSLDEIARRTGLPVHQVTAAMTMLTIKGAVTQRPGDVFAARGFLGA